MIQIEQLRYVRLGTADLDGASDFATRVLGLQPVGRDEQHAWFRSDARDHSLCYVLGDPAEQTVGIELRDAEALARAEQELRAAGMNPTRGDAETNAERRVMDHLTVSPAGGPSIDLVLRPLNTGWRYFPSRDAGVTGFHGVALRARDIDDALSFWTGTLSGHISDYLGRSAYIRVDQAHHRVTLYESPGSGILEVQYAIEGIDQLMQNSYWMQGAQVPIAHGPGRRPASQQAFMSLRGPDGMLFGLVTQGIEIADANHLPRQFRRTADSLCDWGSRSDVPEWRPAD